MGVLVCTYAGVDVYTFVGEGPRHAEASMKSLCVDERKKESRKRRR